MNDAAPGLPAATRQPLSTVELWLLRGTIVLSGIYAVIVIGERISAFSGFNDFFVFWSAAKWTIERGFSPHIYDFETFHAFQSGLAGGTMDRIRPFAYPPTALILFAPLGIMSKIPALVAFMVATLAFYVAAISWGHGRMWIAAVVSPAVALNIIGGQNGFLTAALLVGGVRLATSHPAIAGVCIGLLTIKPQLGIPLPFALIAARQWAVLSWAILVAGGLFLTSLVIGGVEPWLAWLDLLPKFAVTTTNNVDTALSLMVSPTAVLVLLGVDYHDARWLQIPVTVIFIAAIWKVCRDRGLTPMTLAAICAGTLLVTPFGYLYDMTIPNAATLYLALEAARRGTKNGEVFVVVLAWALPILAFSSHNMRDMPLLHALAPLGLALLFLAILRRIYGNDGEPAKVESPAARGHG